MTFLEILQLINCILAIIVIGAWIVYGIYSWIADTIWEKKTRKQLRITIENLPYGGIDPITGLPINNNITKGDN
jgi:hypothetical protein